MRKNDSPLNLRDIPVALSLLSRLPLKLPEAAYARGAHTAWAWPLVGIVLGGLAAMVTFISQAIGVTSQISALLGLATLTILSGAMHEDGLADCADGFWGGYDRARRLEIMKDSRIGAYGVLALILAFGLRWSALAALAPVALMTAIITAAILSRAAMAAVMHILPNARAGGLSDQTGNPELTTITIAALLAALLTFGLVGWEIGLLLIGITGLTALIWAAIAQSKISGQTGDVLGATQQITEIAALIALTATL